MSVVSRDADSGSCKIVDSPKVMLQLLIAVGLFAGGCYGILLGLSIFSL